ncbi:MAG: zinc ribbon domain-containing protein [Anaerolineae bacterium]|nr:zinc ribbon domain-containing protein [Anaerolineae bacterium]
MSELLDSIKQGASQVISGIDQKGQIKSAFEGIKTQLNELEHKRRITQYEGQLRSLQNEMKQLTEALGLQTLSLYDAGKITYPELSRLCERINEIRSESEQKKAELTELKVASTPRPKIVDCPRCQTKVSEADEFCPKCGERLKQPVQATPPTPQPQVVTRLRCPKCKTILPNEADFCPGCGAKLKRPGTKVQSAKKYCASCGAEMGVSSRFCPVCGQAAQ